MKIVHHYVSGRFDWLIFGQQSVNPSRESILYCMANTKDFRLSILWLKAILKIATRSSTMRSIIVNNHFQFPYFDEQNFNR